MKDGRATCHAQREGRACRQRRWGAWELAVGVARGLRLSVRSRAFARGGTRSSRLARARATTLLQSYARVTNVPRRSPLSRRIAPVMPLRRAGACLALFALIALALAPAPCDAQTTKQARSPALSSTPFPSRRNLPRSLASTRTATHRPASSLSHIVHRVAQATRRSAAAAADRPVVDDASRKYFSTQRPHPPKCRKDGSPCLAVEGYDDGKPCTGPYGTCVDGTCEEGGDMSRIPVKASISCTRNSFDRLLLLARRFPTTRAPRTRLVDEHSPSPPSRSKPRRGVPVRRRPHGSLQVRLGVAHHGPVRQQGSAVQVRRRGDVRDQLSSGRHRLRRRPPRRSVQGCQAVLREQVHGCVSKSRRPHLLA